MRDSLVISREKQGDSFTYLKASQPIHDAEQIAWIKSLTIPPAWSNVKISRSKRAKILATGFDKAGRQQYVYNPTFRARQEKLKFDRMLGFAQNLPKLRAQVEKDLNDRKLTQDKVLACVVKLIDDAYFRVGNEKYAHDNQSYGITTIRSKHIDVEGDAVVFDFIGKSGKRHVKKITDHQIAQIIKKLDDMPGYEVFCYKDEAGKTHDIQSADVNEYIKRHMGEDFSAKDFRTWGGTLVATTELLAEEFSQSKTEQKKMVTGVVTNVSKKLGNTPAVARSSYIDPRVLAVHADKLKLDELKAAMNDMRPKKYMTSDEQCLLRILRGK